MITGNLFSEQGAAATAVTLRFENRELLITDDRGVERSFSREMLRIAPKLGRLPREVKLPTREQLVCEQSSALNNWLDGESGEGVSALESNRRWVLGSVVLVPAFLYVVFGWLMPWAAVHFANLVPDSVKVVASQQSLAALDATLLDPSELSDAEQGRMRMAFYDVSDRIDTEHKIFSIQFRHAPTIGPNAFALPDGTIVFTDEIVELVDGDQSLLNAIYLHEVGHVENNHSMQLVAESLFATLAVSYFFGDISGSLEAFFGIGSTVVSNKFTQAHETDADDFALRQLRNSGQDPMAFADAMKKLSQLRPSASEAVDNWFSSHPAIQSRIERAMKFADGQGEAPVSD